MLISTKIQKLNGAHTKYAQLKFCRKLLVDINVQNFMNGCFTM